MRVFWCGAFVLLLALTGCDAAAESDGTIIVPVTNASPVPLRNVTIGEVEVGDFPNGLDDDRISVDDVVLPGSGEYIVTAEIDSAAGDVRTFTYTANFLDDARHYLSLPSDYLAVWVTPGNSTTSLDYRFRYGNINFGFFPSGADQFLGVYGRSVGQSGVAELWLNGSKQSEFSVSAINRSFGWYIDFTS